MLKRVKVRGAVILRLSLPLWTIVPSAIALSCLIAFVQPVVPMLAGRLLRSKARKRRQARWIDYTLVEVIIQKMMGKAMVAMLGVNSSTGGISCG